MANSTEIHKAIEAANKTMMATYSQGDVEGVVALHTKNAQLFPPNSDCVTGGQALQALFQTLLDTGIKAIKLETIETERYGDTASEIGRYILEGDGSQVLDRGKYIVIWKREADQWKIHRDIFNTSMPAPE